MFVGYIFDYFQILAYLAIVFTLYEMFQVSNHSLSKYIRKENAEAFAAIVGFLAGINYALMIVPVGVLLLYYSARKIKEEWKRGIYDVPEHALVMVAGALLSLVIVGELLKSW